VYLHKTVLVAEKMMIKITERVRELYTKKQAELTTGTAVDYFLTQYNGIVDQTALQHFVQLDDIDFIHAVKVWSTHSDVVLRTLCKNLLDRKLLKIKLQAEAFNEELTHKKLQEVCLELKISQEEGNYFVFTGEAVNTMYKTSDEHIKILFKEGVVKDISQVDNALIHKTLATAIKKFYICYYQ
jgi:HD superfamily phosphohydrolase